MSYRHMLMNLYGRFYIPLLTCLSALSKYGHCKLIDTWFITFMMWEIFQTYWLKVLTLIILNQKSMFEQDNQTKSGVFNPCVTSFQIGSRFCWNLWEGKMPNISNKHSLLKHYLVVTSAKLVCKGYKL